VRSTLMIFIQNQSPRRPRHHSVSLANAPSSSLLATPAPAVAHAWYSFRGGVVCPGVPWRAAASSQAREGISSMATIPCACTSKHPRRPAQVQFHPLSGKLPDPDPDRTRSEVRRDCGHLTVSAKGAEVYGTLGKNAHVFPTFAPSSETSQAECRSTR